MRSLRTTRPAGQRRGFALALALVAIVVIGALIAGAFFASTQDFRVGRNTLVEQRAFAVAEYGLNREIANWDTKRNLPWAGVDAQGNAVSGMQTGQIDSSRVYVDVGDTARVKITRLNENTFWVVSEGHASIGNKMLESIRRTSMMVRTAYPTIATSGAIVTAGSISISGSALISGNNVPPSGWQQCDSIGGTDVAAIVAPLAATVSYNSNNINSNIGVRRDAAAGDSNTYVRYGTETWNTLVKNADITLNGDVDPIPVDSTISTTTTLGGLVTTSTTKICNTFGPKHLTNWGEPFRNAGYIDACKNYFPIIYSPGDLHLNSNARGQGILLVNGNLQINGRFEFYGLVIVRDDINKGNGTAKVTGSILARNANITDGGTIINGNQDVQYSKCAIESALRGSAVLVKVPQRAWAQLF